MKVLAEPFWAAKQGNLEEEYEDAVWPAERFEGEGSSFRLAVADGATESLFAGRWARVLVQAAGEGRLDLARDLDGLRTLQTAWRSWLAGKELPWFAEEKARQGAFAALVTLALTEDTAPEPARRWEAAGLGDSCLFHVRGDVLLASFPVGRAADFNNRPYLLGSVAIDEAKLAVEMRHTGGTWHPGDAFYLMSDALACWFLREVEDGNPPWAEIQGLGRADEPTPFRDWIACLRSRNAVRNDDCTLLRVEVR